MDEQVIFTTSTTASVVDIHSFEQTNLRQCSTPGGNSIVKVSDKFVFVAQAQKALINVYNIQGDQKRESVEQRLPLPEMVSCLEVVEDQNNGFLPYLLLASTPTGKLYIWEISSGILLSVKPMAHYQAITKIKSILNGRYVITSGNDARVIIWQTMDLVTMEEPKPIAILHDHTLPVTDFQVSCTHGEYLSSSGVKLFTASQDATIRCYDLNMLGTQTNLKKKSTEKNKVQPRLLATFTLPYAVNSFAVDPADRALYVGTSNGCFNLSLFYPLSHNRIVNLLQPMSEISSSKGKIFTLTENVSGSNLQNVDELYSIGQLLVTKIIDLDVQCLQLSLDGTLLLIGDNTGKLSITEIYSKQILRTIQPLTTQQTILGKVTNIVINAEYNSSTNEQFTGGNKLQPGKTAIEKLPTLQRVIRDNSKLGQSHDVWHQVPTRESLVTPLSDFESYMDNLSNQESVFFTSGMNVTSNVPAVADQNVTETTDKAKDEEIAELKSNIETLTNAYKELRQMHEKLLNEHERV
ncbi:hypothetical protein Kpol_1044p27 [Vanderwaltozyma polyspora DSM 70294]|uniref:Pre-rRNA-processing protein IPI3 n=1 Tax=Vanderwaltozyma polyspora (strain ATCC 22028 / DSM 70294 / BCRC 21397 / CBS 2163 / NBRC 10782 / NRRL Y-8283 / UCD 57-17) TaxID=436907 RepID=A7TP57_VANPO|nr:uncharacterized protein Kpol_1044p27 [Vanderwaltozyma polyspora DSM 70294]EDO15967.1 hypothetical protein Kpol_1044p27 [Vanderwaltozyma polyspora DSM 70294]